MTREGSCGPAHHDPDHGDLDEGKVAASAVFDVPGEAAAAVDPTEDAHRSQPLPQRRDPGCIAISRFLECAILAHI